MIIVQAGSKSWKQENVLSGRVLSYIRKEMPDREGLIKRVFHAKIMIGEDHEQGNSERALSAAGDAVERSWNV